MKPISLKFCAPFEIIYSKIGRIIKLRIIKIGF